MEINVKIETVLPVQTFTKRDGSVGERFAFVGKTTRGQYDKSVKFDVLSKEIWDKVGSMQVGGTYQVSFDVESREWNGKWFTSCNAWRVVPVDVRAGDSAKAVTPNVSPAPSPSPSSPLPSPTPAAPSPAGNSGGSDDLPF